MESGKRLKVYRFQANKININQQLCTIHHLFLNLHCSLFTVNRSLTNTHQPGAFALLTETNAQLIDTNTNLKETNAHLTYHYTNLIEIVPNLTPSNTNLSNINTHLTDTNSHLTRTDTHQIPTNPDKRTLKDARPAEKGFLFVAGLASFLAVVV